MTLALERQLALNAEIDALILLGDIDGLDSADPGLLYECARRYLSAQMNVRNRRAVRGREQSVKVLEQSRAKTALRVRGVVETLRSELAAEWSLELLADKFVLPNGVWVSWADATVAQHEARAKFLEGQATGNVETAAIHRRAISDCLTARTDSLGQVPR